MLHVLDFSPSYCAKLMLFVNPALVTMLNDGANVLKLWQLLFNQKYESFFMGEMFNQRVSAFY